MTDLKELFKPYGKITRFNEPLSKHTSFGIGGPAEVFISPTDIDQLKEIYALCRENKLPVHILGNGTNLLVSDKGVKGIVIKTNLTGLNISGKNIEVEAGYGLSHLINKCISAGLQGFEVLAGIPGSIGGAVAMNAGGKYGNISDYLASVIILNRFGEESLIDKSKLTFGYRTSSLKGKNVILSANFRLNGATPDELKNRFQKILEEKNLLQPLADKSAGCVFKNPARSATSGSPDNFGNVPTESVGAGKLIDQTGLKGYAIGGAKVSEKHANYIINTGNAKSEDITNLINHIQNVVKTKFNISLEPEIEMW
ncbi:MAG: UDP-N-acetylmuramate dehydrogenase [Planctomycetes bacterium]|nr:UDP-N-acetylmuramate dehydrogenase [Planctomycetota bacterium]